MWTARPSKTPFLNSSPHRSAAHGIRLSCRDTGLKARHFLKVSKAASAQEQVHDEVVRASMTAEKLLAEEALRAQRRISLSDFEH